MSNYNNVNISKLNAMIEEYQDAIIEHENTLESIENILEDSSKFKNCGAVKNIKNSLNRIHTVSTLTGGTENLKTKLEALDIAAYWIELYQKIFKKLDTGNDDENNEYLSLLNSYKNNISDSLDN